MPVLVDRARADLLKSRVAAVVRQASKNLEAEKAEARGLLARPVDYREALDTPPPELGLPTLRDDQDAIARHPAKVKVLAMGRRWGKTILGLVLVILCAYRGGRVAWIVPTYKNGRALWRAAERAALELRRRGLVSINRAERVMEFPRSGGFLAIYSADNPDSIRSEWFNLVIFDEAARIAEEVWTDVVQPTLADVGGDAILISTPLGRNWFWRMWREGIEDMKTVAAFRAPTTDNPNELIKRAAAFARDRLPERAYRQEWLAEFVEEASASWDRDWLRERRYDLTKLEPACIARILSYDTAIKENDSAAFSACVVAELLPDYRLRIRHVWRDRLGLPRLMEAMERDIALWDGDGKLWQVVIEDKASGTSAYQTLMASGSDRLRRMLVAFTPQGSKEARFEQAGVWAANGSLLLPFPGPQSPWLRAYEEELFDETEYADQRDATAQVVLWLEPYLAEGFEARGGRAADPHTPPPVRQGEMAPAGRGSTP